MDELLVVVTAIVLTIVMIVIIKYSGIVMRVMITVIIAVSSVKTLQASNPSR